MLRNGGGDTERKAIKGTVPLFPLRLPQPYSGVITAVFDADAVILAASVNVALTAVRTPDTVDGIGANRVTLTDSGDGLAAGRLGVGGTDMGAAFLITTDGGWFPIVVSLIRAGEITLSTPLPHGVQVSVANPAEVRYAVHLGAIPAGATVALTGANPIPWKVDYTADLGTSITPHPSQRIGGVLHVRDRIFDTTLDHHGFVALMRGIAGPDAVYGEQGSWTPQIDAAHMALVQWVRAAATGNMGAAREDDIDGGAFRLAHAWWTASFIEENTERRSELLASAMATAKDALDSLVQTNADTGIPVVEDHGIRASLLGGGSAPRDATAVEPYFIGRSF